MTYAYLASPYSGTLKEMSERYDDVQECACNLMQAGHHVFSPIVHCHPMALEYGLPTDAQFWQKYNKAMLQGANQLFVLTITGWRKSDGVAFERDFAITLDIPETLIDIAGKYV